MLAPSLCWGRTLLPEEDKTRPTGGGHSELPASGSACLMPTGHPGKSITLNGKSFTVAGVLHHGFYRQR